MGMVGPPPMPPPPVDYYGQHALPPPMPHAPVGLPHLTSHQPGWAPGMEMQPNELVGGGWQAAAAGGALPAGVPAGPACCRRLMEPRGPRSARPERCPSPSPSPPPLQVRTLAVAQLQQAAAIQQQLVLAALAQQYSMPGQAPGPAALRDSEDGEEVVVVHAGGVAGEGVGEGQEEEQEEGQEEEQDAAAQLMQHTGPGGWRRVAAAAPAPAACCLLPLAPGPCA